MRPEQKAPDNDGVLHVRYAVDPASMRPEQKAPDNAGMMVGMFLPEMGLQ